MYLNFIGRSFALITLLSLLSFTLPVSSQPDPIFNPSPPSTLLPAGSTQLNLSVQTTNVTACRYSVGSSLPYGDMTSFANGSGTTQHTTTISGLNPDPNTLNNVFVRCESNPDYVLPLKYRSLSQVNPSYPRTGNLWGQWDFDSLEEMAKIDLWLGIDKEADELRQLRQLNPHIRLLASMNAVESGDGLPEGYYLQDINGNRVEVWPGYYRLNLAKLEVAEFMARNAYERVIDSDMMYDGMFFDNVFLSQSWVNDIYGNEFLHDYNEDGVYDDPAAFDAAWRAGVLHEIRTFRELMPNAIISGHAMDVFDPEIAELFNALSIGFDTANVIEGWSDFFNLWDKYTAWHTLSKQPYATMVESAVPNEIAYGYDYSPFDKMPASTALFAQHYYPYMRFGLAFTLMNDGYFAHELGDTWHGNNWWYDELDFDLGMPLGAAQFISATNTPTDNLITNGSFESSIDANWSLWADTANGYTATVQQDSATSTDGAVSARIDITASGGETWRVGLSQSGRSIVKGKSYELSFSAKSNTPRSIEVMLTKDSPNWDSYGLWRLISISSTWQEYRVSFTSKLNAVDARLLFSMGDQTGSVWLDNVQIKERPASVLRRDFANGIALLNATNQTQTISLEPGFRRLNGDQAALYEYIVDDKGDAFTFSGGWSKVEYDSGTWKATGPFYHDWGDHAHQSVDGEARWDLQLSSSDVYTITAWYPAAPSASTWNSAVVYEIVQGDTVVASATINQRTGGDEWHQIGQVQLSPGAFVRMKCSGGAPCIADALHVRSQSRYNNGNPVSSVTLQPMDGIILQRDTATSVNLLVNGSFEMDTNNDKQPDSWTGKGVSEDKRVCNKPTKTVAHEGSCAYRFKGIAGKSARMSQTLSAPPVISGDNLLLSLYANNKSETQADVKIKIKYTSGEKQSVPLTLSPNTPAYQPFTTLFTVEEEVARFKVMMQFKGAAGKVFIDAMRLEKSETVIQLQSLPSEPLPLP
jgi:hypothetical protein